ncbi:putative beta-D-xylosidase 5 [Camellia lanceoleosa]|uniref:Beta-D-xylosidase 5 n=1 Tax=Camellia lanceoleosa TaxID=1840588 RepID=A0ACC0I0V6_9ERIC|nr:putative beta-D-xylosidase 5 [Camellia lanceoleosa]
MIVSFNSFDISALECHNLYLDMVIGLRNDEPNDGTNVVLVFWELSNAHGMLTRTPKKQLVVFERIQVNIEETKKMTVNLDICKQLNIVDWIGLDWDKLPQSILVSQDPLQRNSVVIGIYVGIPCKYTSLLQGLEKFVSKVSYEPECSDMACSNNSQLRATTEVAAVANAVIVVVRLSQSFETEMPDRFNPTSLGYQELLVFEVAKAARGPLVLVVMSGGLVDLLFANNTKVGEILGVGYPGQAGGNAIAQVIFGKFNPGGRSPFS